MLSITASTRAEPLASPVETGAAPASSASPSECPANLGELASDHPSHRELETASAMLLDCWAAALSARHAPSLTRVYDQSVEFFWDSENSQRLAEQQLALLADPSISYRITYKVLIDQFNQVTARVSLATASGNETQLIVSFRVWAKHISITGMNARRAVEADERCTAAVERAVHAIPEVRAWERRVPRGVSTGGMKEPFRDGVFQETLGISFPSYLQTTFFIDVNVGRLHVSQFGAWDLPISAGAAERVRKACVEFEPDCAEACRVLGQCTRRNHTCVATSEAQCRDSEACDAIGHCHLGGRYGNCIAKSDADCTAVDCDQHGETGQCALVGGTCLIPRPAFDEAN